MTEKTIKKSIEFAKNTENTRFNMMLPPKLSTYLKEVSEQKNISKANFIRNLILREQQNI